MARGVELAVVFSVFPTITRLARRATGEREVVLVYFLSCAFMMFAFSVYVSQSMCPARSVYM